MSTYTPSETAGEPGARPPCATCGAAFRLHRQHSPECERRAASGLGGCWCAQLLGYPRCPEAYRPDTLEVARRELADAERSGDEARVFVARGNLQRLEGRA